jgi:hypothetical protein
VLYGSTHRHSAVGPNGRRVSINKGWVRMPDVPQKEITPLEKEITAAFIPILNHVIATLDLSDTRVAVDGQEFPIKTRDDGTLKPDVFLWGKGSSAFHPIDGKPNAKARKKLQDEMQKKPPISNTPTTAQKSGAFEACTPDIDWPWCRVPIEVKTSSRRGGPLNKEPLVQLGTYAREVFAAQTNRRFIPSLILTECAVQFLLWDRAGVVVSEPLDYHCEPLRFCHMLASLVTWDDHQLGFDPTVFYRDRELHIRTKEAFEYVVEETLVRSYTIRSRGSTCWRVRRLGDEDARYIIQDSWVVGSMAAEQAILRKIEDIRVAAGLPGVAPFVHIEEVDFQGTTPSLDTVKHNRRGDGFSGAVDLVHTRTVLRCQGRDCPPLERFTSPMELVSALHDVIKGMVSPNKVCYLMSNDPYRSRGDT